MTETENIGRQVSILNRVVTILTVLIIFMGLALISSLPNGITFKDY